MEKEANFESRGSSSGMVTWKDKINSEGPRKLFAFALLHGSVVLYTFLIPMYFFAYIDTEHARVYMLA